MKPWFSQGLRSPVLTRIAFLAALVLVLSSLAMALTSERDYRRAKLDEAETQARILAASLTAALAFNDQETAIDFVQAMASGPSIDAAAAYNERGILVTWFSRGLPVPVVAPPVRPARIQDGIVLAIVPVSEGGLEVGTALLRLRTEPLSRRLERYLGTGLLAIMAAALVTALAAAQATLARANKELDQRAIELAAANRALQEQMAQREAAEAALREAYKMEAIGQLTGGVAHDFNNLLQAISSSLQTIWTRSPDPRIEPFIQGAQQAVERGASLTRQLLAFARRQPLRPRSISIPERLQNMRGILTAAVRADLKIAYVYLRTSGPSTWTRCSSTWPS